MELLVLVSLLPMIIVNIWHVILISRPVKGTRPLTISEHAVISERRLLVHRAMHSFPVLIFLPFAFTYLMPTGYTLAAMLLVLGSLFDSAQSLTLNKNTAALESDLNAHSLTTWVMAVSYQLYSIVICRIAGISASVYVPLSLVCLILLIFAVLGKFKNRFLFMQTSYFILVSMLVLIAHIQLI